MPDTVATLRSEFEQATAALVAYLRTLPPRATEMPEEYVNGQGETVPPHRGWTDEERQEVTRLRDAERDLAVRLARARVAG